MTRILKLDRGWDFRRDANSAWMQVDLPHTPFVADLDGRQHWFGECEYQRTVNVQAPPTGGRHVLYVGAAMHTARVLVDGVEVGRHEGGYLPFEVDLTGVLGSGVDHRLTVRVDNRDNPAVPPGKPYADLDFCWYGGLYRGVELRTYPPLHITDPVSADRVAGGGVFVRTLSADTQEALLNVKTHVRNSGESREFTVRVEIAAEGEIVAAAESDLSQLGSGGDQHVELQLNMRKPKLWSPDSPVLHQITVKVCTSEGVEIDVRQIRYGIRRIAFSRSGGFVINGRRLRLRGTNRHQEYPHAGYAVPRAAQFRDALRIKEAGFDYVRLSHYPQSPDFLDACDELGLIVMNAIPGWQFIGGERFREACFANARQLIRRDRNHACVVLWELSLNETAMDEAFMARLHQIGHEEFPGDQMFTCGWIDRYDVYIHSRQHGEIHRWENADKALVIAEYGDWEFYAANEGFDQKTGAGVHALWSSARQFRSDGERGLRQQVDNHIIALNDTLSSPAALDGQWCMFDYARGYHPLRAACGVMDIFRLPKFSYYFYRSQREAFEGGEDWAGGPVVYIASHWTPSSNLRVVVFSNCDEVELRLNGRFVAKKKAETAWMTQHLPHPPFFFDFEKFTPGMLEAVGFVGGHSPVTHTVSTPGQPARLELMVDDMGLFASTGEPDLVLAHARICDASGQLCVDDGMSVRFELAGRAELLSPANTLAEAGIASAVIRVPADSTGFVLNASRAQAVFSMQASCQWQGSSPAAQASPALQPV